MCEKTYGQRLFHTNRGSFFVLENEKNIQMVDGVAWDDADIERLRIPVSRSRTILDIGCHVGTHCISYSKQNPESIIHCFEPQKVIYDILLKNIEMNGAENIVPHNKAVGECIKQATMNTCIPEEDDSSVEYGVDRKINYGGLGIGTGGEKVDMVSIDSMELNRVGFVKIDVEGSERAVFYGGRDTILRDRPVIFYEKVGKELSFSPNPSFSIEKFLLENDYTIKRMGTNMLAYPLEKLKKLPIKQIHELDKL